VSFGRPVVHSVPLPTLGRTLTVTEPGPLSSLKVEIDGRALERKGWLRPVYAVPTGEGASVDVEVRWDALRGGIEVRGPEILAHAGAPIPTALAVLAFLPFGLAMVGGAMGGAIGAIGWVVNRSVAALRWPLPARLVLMLGVTVVDVLAWAVLARLAGVVAH
jgi:hypothetical protein